MTIKFLTLFIFLFSYTITGSQNVILFLAPGMNDQLIQYYEKNYKEKSSFYISNMPVTRFLSPPYPSRKMKVSIIPSQISIGLSPLKTQRTKASKREENMTLLEKCQKKGIKTGLISSSELTSDQITPFFFQKSFFTNQHKIIKRPFAKKEFNLIITGGTKAASHSDWELLNKKYGYTFLDGLYELKNPLSVSDFQSLIIGNGSFKYENHIKHQLKKVKRKIKHDQLLKKQYRQYLTTADYRANPLFSELIRPSLSNLSKNTNGFFMIANHSLILVAAQEANLNHAIEEIHQFTLAVEEAINWAKTNAPTNTLVLIVTYQDFGNFENKNTDHYSPYEWTNINSFKKRLLFSFFHPIHKTNKTNRPMPIYAWGQQSKQIFDIENYHELHHLILDMYQR